MEWLSSLSTVDWSHVYVVVTSVVGTAALLATVTPWKKDDEVVGYMQSLLPYVKKVLDLVGANWGHAKNEEPK